MHQINAFETVDAKGNVQLNIDTLAYEDASFMTQSTTFGTLSIFRDVHKLKTFYLHPSFKSAKPTRIRIDLSSEQTSFTPYSIKDENGNDIACELPRINDKFRGKELCIFYAVCGVTGVVTAKIGKINVCTDENHLLYTPAEYADEAEISPGGATWLQQLRRLGSLARGSGAATTAASSLIPVGDRISFRLPRFGSVPPTPSGSVPTKKQKKNPYVRTRNMGQLMSGP